MDRTNLSGTKIKDYGGGVFGVDSGYEREGMAAIYLLRSGRECAVIETAHNASLPRTLEACEKLGIKPKDVKYVCVTHVHLDHAGGAGSYMEAFGDAKLVVQPRGTRHMADPAKLVEGVRAVYGEDETERLYGTVVPVPESRIISAGDGEELPLGDLTLRCLWTPGHAKHHMIFFVKQLRAVFSGDAFGISYEWMRSGTREWVFATASPVQFDPETSRASIELIESLSPARVFLTHFGEINKIALCAAEIKKSLSDYAEITDAARGSKDEIKNALRQLYLAEAKKSGIKMSEAQILSALETDAELNAQGLSFWYDSRKIEK